MAVDHTRRLPFEPERLAHLSSLYFNVPVDRLSPKDLRELVSLALLAEQVEQTRQVAFFLQEAYDIYNNRFRG